MPYQERPQKANPHGLEISTRSLAMSGAVKAMRPGRMFASLSDARLIEKADWYWISSKGQLLSPGVYRGAPSEPGYYRDNKDGTFTKIAERSDVAAKDRLWISVRAASKASRGEDPLALRLQGGFKELNSSLFVESGEKRYCIAHTASVPLAQDSGKAVTSQLEITKELYDLAIAAGREISGAVKPARINLASAMELSQIIQRAYRQDE